MNLKEVISKATDDHPLKISASSNHRYYTDFLKAMDLLKNNLSKKEYNSIIKKLNLNNPFDLQRYLQIVAEINVLHYILLNYNNNFRYEPKYNGANNVECSFGHEMKTINIEVKCPNLEKRKSLEGKNTLQIHFTDRIPNHRKISEDLQRIIYPNLINSEYTDLKEIPRVDNKMKDFLVSA